MQILLRRDNAFNLFRNINNAVLHHYVGLKREFKENAIPSHLIIAKFKDWKVPLEATIHQEIVKLMGQEELPEGITQTNIITKIIQNYKEEQQFIELFRNLNSTVVTIQDFIRSNALKDTSKDQNGT